jgi:hypothetical protein
MNRCAPWVVAALAACAAAASAQIQRPYTASTLRGELVITQPPDALLNGQPARLAPGGRIRGVDNLLQLSGGLVGQRLVVHYTLDPLGLLMDVWILTAQERARQPWPSTPAEAAAWSFNPSTQTWSRR